MSRAPPKVADNERVRSSARRAADHLRQHLRRLGRQPAPTPRQRRQDLAGILVAPEASLVQQYTALMRTEGITLKLAHEVNSRVENIGARRLQTVMEKLPEEVSFTASNRGGETVAIDAAYVRREVADLGANADLSKFIL